MTESIRSAKSPNAIDKMSEGFTDEERLAMKQRAQELKAAARTSSRADKTDGENAVLAAIAAMPSPYCTMGERLHAIITASAPVLTSRLWYGMPAYARDGKIVCFFRGGDKFKERYMTLGFNDVANLDEGTLWPIAFALKELTAAEEAKIGALIKKAEYWTLDLNARQLHIHREPTNGEYAVVTVHAETEIVTLAAHPDAPVAVADILPPAA